MMPHLAESEQELKSLLMKVKKQSGKAGLKLNIQKTKIMASGPITSWQIEGGKVEAVTNFLFFGSKITEDGDCRHEIKRCLLLGRKAMANLDSVLKSRDIILLTKVYIVKGMFFPVSGSFLMSWIFTSGGQSIGASASAISSSNEYSGLISFRIDLFDLLAVQGTLKSLLWYHNSKASVLSLLYGPTLTSVYDYWKSQYSFDYMDLCLQSDISALNAV